MLVVFSIDPRLSSRVELCDLSSRHAPSTETRDRDIFLATVEHVDVGVFGDG